MEFKYVFLYGSWGKLYPTNNYDVYILHRGRLLYIIYSYFRVFSYWGTIVEMSLGNVKVQPLIGAKHRCIAITAKLLVYLSGAAWHPSGNNLLPLIRPSNSRLSHNGTVFIDTS